MTLIAEWKAYVEDTKPDALVFSTKMGTPILPNNVVRRFILPACKRLGLPRSTWLTFRRTYSSWSHDRGVPGKVVAQLMGHANVDTTLNVYTQVLARRQLNLPRQKELTSRTESASSSSTTFLAETLCARRNYNHSQE